MYVFCLVNGMCMNTYAMLPYSVYGMYISYVVITYYISVSVSLPMVFRDMIWRMP